MKTKFKGKEIQLKGVAPAVGSKAPSFCLAQTDLSDFCSDEHKDKYLVLNVFPSLDTSVCAMTVRKFNERAAKLKDTLVLCVSRDLPFAQGRFCVAEGIKNVIPLSEFHLNSTFGTDYGVVMESGPLNGLLARAVYVLSPDRKVVYSELVPEVTQEPDYDAAISALEKAQ